MTTVRQRSRRRAPSASTLWQQAQQHLAHGVNSPVRAFAAVGGEPIFLTRGHGAYVWDVRGQRYLDYVGGWGPHLLGHAPAPVIQAIARQLRRGTTLGLPTALETALAQRICAAFPSIERVRFTCSGTEACMSALRLARAATGRTKLLKFAGGYHGHADPFLVQAGSGVATFARGTATSAGIPEAVVQDTLVVEFNDLEAVQRVMAQEGPQIAAIILEPCAANMGVVPPQPGFLQTLRELSRQWGSVLIFDEVITGFRVTYGGVQHQEQVQPDLNILGKIIGGGLPIGAFGGRAALMALLAPGGPVYQAGTLAGHPLAMAAGVALLDTLRSRPPYRLLEQRTQALARGMRTAATAAGLPVHVNAYHSLLSCFFTDEPVTNWTSAHRADAQRYARFFHAMRQQGILLPPSQFESWFLSQAHGPREIHHTLRAVEDAFHLDNR